MPHVELQESAFGLARPRLRVRDEGRGPAVLVLHGGWGYGFYPFDTVTRRLVAEGRRIVGPDRLGFGGSTPIEDVPLDFHDVAATDMAALLDAMGIGDAQLVGHSDGAVIALRMGLGDPSRFPRIVAIAAHLWPSKGRTQRFFRDAAEDPRALGARPGRRLEAEHGSRWSDLIRSQARAWMALAAVGVADLYDGQLDRLESKVLVVHGARDPRTEPGELDALVATIPKVDLMLLAEAGHAPHSESATAEAVADRIATFLA